MKDFGWMETFGEISRQKTLQSWKKLLCSLQKCTIGLWGSFASSSCVLDCTEFFGPINQPSALFFWVIYSRDSDLKVKKKCRDEPFQYFGAQHCFKSRSSADLWRCALHWFLLPRGSLLAPWWSLSPPDSTLHWVWWLVPRSARSRSASLDEPLLKAPRVGSSGSKRRSPAGRPALRGRRDLAETWQRPAKLPWTRERSQMSVSSRRAVTALQQSKTAPRSTFSALFTGRGTQILLRKTTQRALLYYCYNWTKRWLSLRDVRLIVISIRQTDLK